jgi:four helix bundle protein
MQDFRHIKAWQRVHALAIALHKRTRNFSRLGYSRLRAQLTGSADSIGDTIMEGAGGGNRDPKDDLQLSTNDARQRQEGKRKQA